MASGPIPETMPDEFDLPMLLAGIPKGFACWDTTTGSPFKWMVPAGVRRVMFLAKGGDSGPAAINSGCPSLMTSFDLPNRGARVIHIDNLEPGSLVTITVGAGGTAGVAGGDTTIALPSGKATVTAKGAGRVTITATAASVGTTAGPAPRASGAAVLNENATGSTAAGAGADGYVVAMW